ncbi:sulfotransferase [Capilliphycus salinus ALCB114379]|uniref:sulfotransferase n=1 Tax=Capilliphycus salinus TaxID=2768948 RepID=UPI0039A6250B
MSLNFESILIITYGRSGSTLLQGMLNEIEGVIIRGENSNFIAGLYEAYRNLEIATSPEYAQKSNAPTHPWYGAGLLDLDVFLTHCQNMVRELLLADRQGDDSIICYGFKEIRYLDFYFKSEYSLAGYLDFLAKIFPNVGFIFNVRNLDDVLKSGWWATTNPADTSEKILGLEQAFKLYVQNNPNNTFLISHEDIVQKSDKLRDLFLFIGGRIWRSRSRSGSVDFPQLLKSKRRSGNRQGERGRGTGDRGNNRAVYPGALPCAPTPVGEASANALTPELLTSDLTTSKNDAPGISFAEMTRS